MMERPAYAVAETVAATAVPDSTASDSLEP
jgi:hypothetical protein